MEGHGHTGTLLGPLSLMKHLLGGLRPRSAPGAPTAALHVLPRRFVEVAVAVVIITVCAAGCGQDPQVLQDEAFRNVIPTNAQLYDEVVGDGSSIIMEGERSVLRTFVPTPPADATEVFATLVEEGESDGWVFTDRSSTLAVGTKEVDGRPWMVSLVVSDSSVQQLFAGR